jgi:hypothetical protein
MRITASLLLLCSFAAGLSGQHRFDPVARSAGGVWIREAGDAWAALGSPPLLSEVRAPAGGAVHLPAPWGLRELSGSAVVVASPLGPGGAGLTLSRFGFDLYSETAVGIAYGAGAGALLFGAAARYTRLAISRYGSAGIVAFDAAVVVVTASWFRWGIRITDLNRPAVGATGERLRESAGFAAAVRLPGGASFLAEACRDDAGSFAGRAGLSWNGRPVFAAVGASGGFDRIHCGIGLTAGPAGFGYGVVVHPELGWSHALWLSMGAGR